MIALAGAEVSFARAAGLLSGLAGIAVSARTIEWSADASGTASRQAAAPARAGPRHAICRARWHRRPGPPSETEGRHGKDGDGKAGTREVKLARLITQSGLDSKGRPVMDPGSSSYAFTFDGKDAFAELVEAEYLLRGGDHFRQVVALGDGAAWIWGMADPHATHIVDVYHAREHLHDLAGHLAFITPTRRNGWRTGSASWTPGTSRPLSTPPVSTLSKGSRPRTWTGNSATSSTTSTGCASPASGSWACSPARGQSRPAANRRAAPQTVRNEMDSIRRHRHPDPALPRSQRPLGRNPCPAQPDPAA